MNTLRLALLAFAAISSASLSAQDPAVSRDIAPQSTPKPFLREGLTAEMGREFDAHDYDHDGYISWQEWEKSNQNDPDFRTNGKTAFEHMDSDHDNRLARQEMIDWSLRMFDCIDDNRDGAITNAEGQKNVQRCMMSETGISAQ